MAFFVGDVCVACFAGLVSGEVDWLRGDFAHRRSTEVSVLSEGVRHQPAADSEKDQDGNDKDSRKPEEMTCIAKYPHQAYLPNTIPRRRDRPY